jgi:hypothetical protein
MGGGHAAATVIVHFDGLKLFGVPNANIFRTLSVCQDVILVYNCYFPDTKQRVGYELNAVCYANTRTYPR